MMVAMNENIISCNNSLKLIEHYSTGQSSLLFINF